ncbi:MAG: hypothetical protein QOC81_3203 [Thermoanaerobaculia bacterium]|nr:hypothetical protein [Thermoanaerobaculia bacterium]
MAEDAWELLMRFHRELLKPEFDRLRSSIGELIPKAELDFHAKEIAKRFDRLHRINQDIAATLRRIEEANQNALEMEAEMNLKHASRH